MADGCFYEETIVYGVMMETYADAGYTDNTRTYGFRDSTFYTNPPVFKKINDVDVWGCGNQFMTTIFIQQQQQKNTDIFFGFAAQDKLHMNRKI